MTSQINGANGEATNKDDVKKQNSRKNSSNNNSNTNNKINAILQQLNKLKITDNKIKKQLLSKKPAGAKKKKQARQAHRTPRSGGSLKVPPAVTTNHIPASSLGTHQTSRINIAHTSNNHDLLVFMPFRPVFMDAAGGAPIRPAHMIALRIINDSGSYSIAEVQAPLLLNSSISSSMIQNEQDLYKINHAKFKVMYDGSHAFRMGKYHVYNPPTFRDGQVVTDSLNGWFNSNNSGASLVDKVQAYRLFVNNLVGNRYSRQYNINSHPNVEETVPLHHEWQIMDTDGDRTYLHHDDVQSTETGGSTVTVSGSTYYIPNDCCILYIPGGTSQTPLPVFTVITQSVVEFSLRNHPGLMTPSLPPSQMVTNTVHAIKTAFQYASQNPTAPLLQAMGPHVSKIRSTCKKHPLLSEVINIGTKVVPLIASIA